MHELSVARSILDTMASVASLATGERYGVVRLRVGEISGIEPDALDFGLTVLATERGWSGIDFQVERTPLRRRCPCCDMDFAVGDADPDCPRCGNPKTLLSGGNELELLSIDVESPE